MYSALELTNRLHAEAGRISESELPLEVFPQKVQEIIFNIATYENFNIEYSASIVLSGCGRRHRQFLPDTDQGQLADKSHPSI